MAVSIKSKLTPEEWVWADLNKKLAKLLLKPKELTPSKKHDAVRNLYIYIDYLWMTESQGLNDRRACIEHSVKYPLSANAIHKLMKK